MPSHSNPNIDNTRGKKTKSHCTSSTPKMCCLHFKSPLLACLCHALSVALQITRPALLLNTPRTVSVRPLVPQVTTLLAIGRYDPRRRKRPCLPSLVLICRPSCYWIQLLANTSRHLGSTPLSAPHPACCDPILPLTLRPPQPSKSLLPLISPHATTGSTASRTISWHASKLRLFCFYRLTIVTISSSASSCDSPTRWG